MGALKPKPEDGSGDVKYHLGLSVTRPTTSGKQVAAAAAAEAAAIINTRAHALLPSPLPISAAA